MITDRYHAYRHPSREPLRGHDGTVKTVAAGALPDTAVIINGARDGTVRVS